jgi:NADH-quinone oxidoreductase subunit N
MMLGGANDLIMVFRLEVMSVAAYVLAAYDRRSPFSAEAGLKYFLIGAFASGFLLYGIALSGPPGPQPVWSACRSRSGRNVAALGLGLLLGASGSRWRRAVHGRRTCTTARPRRSRA